MKEKIKIDFSPTEFQRYARHFVLSEVGMEGQKRLKAAKVLCVGAGGLASPALLYFAAAGIGTLGIVDDDQVELSNLQRQILYTTNNIGQSKGPIARDRLLELNPHIQVTLHSQRLTRDNALTILSAYDIILDCTDNFYSRYVINDACFYLKKPDIYASILRFEGQCSIFYSPEGPCYRCLFKAPPPPELIPNCAEGGVIGALPGLLGTLQAMEAIKFILHQGTSLIGRLLMVNALTMQFRELTISKNPDCPLCAHQIPFEQLPLPEASCKETSDTTTLEITAQHLHALKQKEKNIFLLDVREPFEYEICNLGGYLIPLKELTHRFNELNPTQPIIIYCKMGSRSQKAAAILKQHGFLNVSTLKGGVLTWINEIDPCLTKY